MSRVFSRSSVSRYSEHWWAKLGLLVALSLCFKLWVLLRVEVINPDGVLYLRAASHYLSGNFTAALNVYPMPFYPLLIAIVGRFLVPHLVLAGQLLSVFFLTGMLVPCYLLVREAWNDTAAFWAGVLLATSPYFNRHAVDIVRDPAFLFFLAWATWATWRLLKTKDWRWAALAGIMTTLATLSRIEGALLFFALPAAWLLGTRGLSIGRRIGMLAILILTGPACISPFAAWLTFRIGEIPASRLPELLSVKQSFSLVAEQYQLHYDMLKNLEKQLPDGGQPYNLFELTRHYIPFVYLIGLAESLLRVVYPSIFIVALAGLRYWRQVPIACQWLLGLVFASYLSLALLRLFQDVWYSNRFIYAPALILTLWAGHGVVVIWRWQRERWQRGWTRWAATIMILVLLLSPAVKALMYEHGREENIRQAGLWLADHSPSAAILLTNDSRIAFYADRKFAHLGVHGDTNNSISRHKWSYIVLRCKRDELARFPVPSGYEEVQRFPGERRTVVIFQSRGY